MAKKTSGKTLQRHALNIQSAVERLYEAKTGMECKGTEPMQNGGVCASHADLDFYLDESFTWAEIAEEIDKEASHETK